MWIQIMQMLHCFLSYAEFLTTVCVDVMHVVITTETGSFIQNWHLLVLFFSKTMYQRWFWFFKNLKTAKNVLPLWNDTGHQASNKKIMQVLQIYCYLFNFVTVAQQSNMPPQQTMFWYAAIIRSESRSSPFATEGHPISTKDDSWLSVEAHLCTCLPAASQRCTRHVWYSFCYASRPIRSIQFNARCKVKHRENFPRL